MKIVRILAPFGLSTVMFILAYLSIKDSHSGSFPVIFTGIDIILVVVGIIAIFSKE